MEESQKKLIKTFVLINILLNDIEEPNKVPTKEIKQAYIDILKGCVDPFQKQSLIRFTRIKQSAPQRF